MQADLFTPREFCPPASGGFPAVPTPHAFQVDWADRVREARRREARVIVAQGATGCGKTTFAAHLTAQAVGKNSRVLFMAHRRRLVDQISERLRDFRIHHGLIMRDKPIWSNAAVQVASRDTLLSRCVNNDWQPMPPADLVFVDEGHHCAGEDSEYRRILTQYPAATVILLSATPVGPDGRGLGPWAQALVCAPPTSRLVREGFLVPVKVFAPDRKVERGKVRRRGVAGDLVTSWQTFAEGRPTVLFCSRVKHSEDAVEAFREAGIPAAHVDADTPDDVRDTIFDCLKSGKIKVVSNVGIIGEGVDVPALGCCQLFMETSGRVRFLQAVGRIMRPSPGKQYGILIDHAGAVFRHGFPDEDTEWTLEGSVDEAFAAKHRDGETEKALYCKRCELVYHGGLACPQCGRLPVKPPKSIFNPPDVRTSGEILTEAERAGRVEADREEKVAHWFNCLRTAKKQGSNFLRASAIFKRKYGAFPDNDFPLMPEWSQRKKKITEVYPDFGRRDGQA